MDLDLRGKNLALLIIYRYFNGKELSSSAWFHLSRQSIPPSYSLTSKSFTFSSKSKAEVRAVIEGDSPYMGGSNFAIYVDEGSIDGYCDIPIFKFNFNIEPSSFLSVTSKSTSAFHILIDDDLLTISASNNWQTSTFALEKFKNLSKLSVKIPTSLKLSLKIGSIAIHKSASKQKPKIIMLENVGKTYLDWSYLNLKGHVAIIFVDDLFHGVSYNNCYMLEDKEGAIKIFILDELYEHVFTLVSG